MLTKLKKISKIINPFGGINFVMHEIRKQNIPQLIDNILGERVKQAKYSNSDILLNWIYANFCGAERLEDTKHLKRYFNDIPDTKFPSPDRIGGIFKKLSTENIKVVKSTDSYTNMNVPLNNLLLDTTLKLNLLKQDTNYTLDYDAIVLAAEKYDCQYTYKKFQGYTPVVSFIGKIPVYIEGRSGNTNPAANMEQSLQNTLDLLSKKNIRIKRFRSDAAAYQASVIELMDKNGIEFFIRARNSSNVYDNLVPNQIWERIAINNMPYEITSVMSVLPHSKYATHDKKYDLYKKYRVIISRRLIGSKSENNSFVKDNLVYRAIITSNTSMTDKEVIEFYNQRGSMERNFDMLLNDFNWRRLPFSFLEHNTVFLFVGALASVLYRHVIIKFNKKVDFLKENFRLKAFIFRFITMSTLWKKEELILFETTRDYAPLLDG